MRPIDDDQLWAVFMAGYATATVSHLSGEGHSQECVTATGEALVAHAAGAEDFRRAALTGLHALLDHKDATGQWINFNPGGAAPETPRMHVVSLGQAVDLYLDGFACGIAVLTKFNDPAAEPTMIITAAEDWRDTLANDPTEASHVWSRVEGLVTLRRRQQWGLDIQP